MSDRWIPEPRFMPRRCFLQRHADPAIGPYFEFERAVGELDPQGRPTGRPENIYLSQKAVSEILRSPGSPFRDPTLETERLREQIRQLEVELLRIAGEREDLERKLDERTQNGRVSDDELIERITASVAEKMDERDALKNAERMARARAGRKKAQGAT